MAIPTFAIAADGTAVSVAATGSGPMVEAAYAAPPTRKVVKDCPASAYGPAPAARYQESDFYVSGSSCSATPRLRWANTPGFADPRSTFVTSLRRGGR